ncbi:unnamed protein product [Somion occarium]|uniref:C2H2-type domain-containing protein n=1 Tax=Somion occarium TaxID=3059160 RepID=A0ABP1DUW3_9APHY
MDNFEVLMSGTPGQLSTDDLGEVLEPFVNSEGLPIYSLDNVLTFQQDDFSSPSALCSSRPHTPPEPFKREDVSSSHWTEGKEDGTQLPLPLDITTPSSDATRSSVEPSIGPNEGERLPTIFSFDQPQAREPVVATGYAHVEPIPWESIQYSEFSMLRGPSMDAPAPYNSNISLAGQPTWMQQASRGTEYPIPVLSVYPQAQVAYNQHPQALQMPNYTARRRSISRSRYPRAPRPNMYYPYPAFGSSEYIGNSFPYCAPSLNISGPMSSFAHMTYPPGSSVAPTNLGTDMLTAPVYSNVPGPSQNPSVVHQPIIHFGTQNSLPHDDFGISMPQHTSAFPSLNMPTPVAAASTAVSQHLSPSQTVSRKRPREDEELRNQLPTSNAGDPPETQSRKGNPRRDIVPQPGVLYQCRWRNADESLCGMKLQVVSEEGKPLRNVWTDHLKSHISPDTSKTDKIECRWKNADGSECPGKSQFERCGRHIVEIHFGLADIECQKCGKWISGGITRVREHDKRTHIKKQRL